MYIIHESGGLSTEKVCNTAHFLLLIYTVFTVCYFVLPQVCLTALATVQFV